MTSNTSKEQRNQQKSDVFNFFIFNYSINIYFLSKNRIIALVKYNLENNHLAKE